MAEKKTTKVAAAPEKEPSKLYRSETNRIIAGVCGGLGEYFKIDPSLIRLLFIIIIIFGGSGVLLYIILWIIIPTESDVVKTSDDHIRANVAEIRSKAEKFAQDMRINRRKEDSRFWWGIIILILGVTFLLSNFGIFGFFNFGKLWPLILIFFGLLVLLRRR